MRTSFSNGVVSLQGNYIIAQMTERESISPWVGFALLCTACWGKIHPGSIDVVRMQAAQHLKGFTPCLYSSTYSVLLKQLAY